MADPVAHEDADQPGLGPVEGRRVGRRAAVVQNRGPGIPVGGDRVPLPRIVDLVDQKRQRDLVVAVSPNDEGVADPLGIEEGTATEEVVALGPVPDQR